MTAEAAGADIDAELVGVVKRFGLVTAIDGVDLAVRRGEFLSLLGPSGCGKTTALRLLAGFEQPTEGSILIGGVDAVGIPPYRRNVNTVFQHYALFPHMSVLENVAYGLKQRRVAGTERTRLAEEALELVQLRNLANRRPRELSGGQQQRVALARALVLRPRVLLLDEPLGALDLKLRREMQIELKRMQTQLDLTFVYVTHDQEEAMSMSDRIAVMSGGRIEQLDRPLVIYDRPASAFVAGFIGDMNFLEGEVVEADGDRWSAAVGPSDRARPRRGAARRGGAHRGASRERRDRAGLRAGGRGQPRRRDAGRGDDPGRPGAVDRRATRRPADRRARAARGRRCRRRAIVARRCGRRALVAGGGDAARGTRRARRATSACKGRPAAVVRASLSGLAHAARPRL